MWAGAPETARVGEQSRERAAQLARSLHLPGIRDTHRAHLLEAKAALESALRTAEPAQDGTQPASESTWLLACRQSLLGVYCAFAEDARYGAGQLSRGAQRAPSEADCEDGWLRVEEIVCGAEEVAKRARALANLEDSTTARKLADSTERSAWAARSLTEGRNRAYTFHTDAAFSFGEGWYAAAAAVLARATLQLEPGQKHTLAAERFLLDAGLGGQLRPYLPRPRANKALPLLVADAFQTNPSAAQTRLRTAFLARRDEVQAVRTWLREKLGQPASRRAVLIWIRTGAHDAHRNSTADELRTLCLLAQQTQLSPILIGDGLGAMPLPRGALDLTLFWKESLFQGLFMRRAQLELFECLRETWSVVGQCGVTTADMDGPALLGLPTLYLTDEPNVRLGRWVGAVPGYEEVVRDGHHEERVKRRFGTWAGL